MSSHPRLVRYGSPIAVVIVGLLFAAADTHSLGNTVATVLIAVGLIWFMAVVGRDIGMGERAGRRRHVPAPPPDADETPGAGGHAGRASRSGRAEDPRE